MMLTNSVSPAVGPAATGPTGWTDLNTLLNALLADCAATHVRCESLPGAAGPEEEWYLLLRWLLQPLRAASSTPRYVHVQTAEYGSGNDLRYRVTVRCNGLEGLVRAFAFANPQLAGIASRLGVVLAQPAEADDHCLFILELPGKKLIHAHH
ncbi:hypothetical protein EPD60_06460 [Flaviaesturariibacter flavus]|uniref:Uncharacterized protein n=1 Tax=Flaviaesturariibacter flavus TaxID=2502780 RepID=A0A4R1BKC5_9BACT|nr:hypothetical protein [Flaviaesturariibacter flavus]TCJ17821.1 hypothetical protein EPD60_06460 [Flaviaesturariibacter flavus]